MRPRNGLGMEFDDSSALESGYAWAMHGQVPQPSILMTIILLDVEQSLAGVTTAELSVVSTYSPRGSDSGPR